MKVLLADKLPDSVADRLLNSGLEMDIRPALTTDELPAALAGVHILVVRSTQVTAAAIQDNPSLMLIIRAGAGTNTIDVAEAAKRGIYVANTPGQNAAAVSELTMGLLLAIDRKLVPSDNALKEGRWDKKGFGNADGLLGRTLGIIGFGQIGQAVAQRASAFGMNVIAYSRSLTEEHASTAGVGFRASVTELCRDSDVISLHVALNPETRGILGAEQFDAMREGAVVLNTSRGGLIQKEPLLKAIDNKGIRVGLDVYDDEPASGEERVGDAVALHEGVVGTHHIGASTMQAQNAVADEVVRIIETFKATGHVDNCVNLSLERSAPFQLVVRHEDRVGVLAGVLDVLKKNTINVGTMENLMFEGGLAAICIIRINSRPSEAVLSTLQEDLEGIFGVQLVEIS